MTLKTLKDLIETESMWTSGFANVKELKQEAIKWIKTIQGCHNLKSANKIGKDLFVTSDMDDDYYADEVIAFIKLFFNISEEDLK